MKCTQANITYCFEELPEIDWHQSWQKLADRVERIVQPNPKKEMIWWKLVPATALKTSHLIINGHVELCRTIHLPRAASASLFQTPLIVSFASVSPKPIQIEIEWNEAGHASYVRPQSDTLETAAQHIAKRLR